MKHQLTIHPEDSVEVFQKKFNHIYPYLKVEFFKKSHRKGQGSHKKDMYAGSDLFKVLAKINEKKTFSGMTICLLMHLNRVFVQNSD